MEETVKYHSQRQALEFAAQIIPVPAAYPLKPGLPEDYRECFLRKAVSAGKGCVSGYGREAGGLWSDAS